MIKSISEAREDHLRSFTPAAVDSGPTTATNDPWSSFTPAAVDSGPTTATNIVAFILFLWFMVWGFSYKVTVMWFISFVVWGFFLAM